MGAEGAIQKGATVLLPRGLWCCQTRRFDKLMSTTTHTNESGRLPGTHACSTWLVRSRNKMTVAYVWGAFMGSGAHQKGLNNVTTESGDSTSFGVGGGCQPPWGPEPELEPPPHGPCCPRNNI